MLKPLRPEWSLRRTLEGLAQRPVTLADEVPANSRSLTAEELAESASLYPNGHLPDGFDASRGIRSLFPPGKSVGLSSLRRYVYSVEGWAATGELYPTYSVRADGAGNWCLRVLISTTGNGRFGAEVVFAFSTDTQGRGIVATGNYGGGISGSDDGIGVSVLAHGLDPWIRDNWPDMFAQPVFLYISEATGFYKLPPIVRAATDHGFSGLTTLAGPKSGDPVPSVIVVFGDPYAATERQSFDFLWALDIQTP